MFKMYCCTFKSTISNFWTSAKIQILLLNYLFSFSHFRTDIHHQRKLIKIFFHNIHLVLTDNSNCFVATLSDEMTATKINYFLTRIYATKLKTSSYFWVTRNKDSVVEVWDSTRQGCCQNLVVNVRSLSSVMHARLWCCMSNG